jgi:ferredoxin
MATITLHLPGSPSGETRRIPLRPAFSLLNSLLAEGVDIPHDCGGKAICGTCRVRPGAGGAALSAMKEAEAQRLAAVDAGEGERLACQAHAIKDIELEIVGRTHREAT